MRLLDAKEVSEMLHVSLARVYELTRQGILPSVRVGARQIRFQESRLLQWIQHGGRLEETCSGAESAEDSAGPIGEKSSASESTVSTRSVRDKSDQVIRLSFDGLREFEPFRFVLECTVRAG